MIAQLSVFPIGEGTSLSHFVKKGVAVIERSGYKHEIGGMGTTIEVPNLDELFDLVKEVHKAQLAEGAHRVMIDLKVDDRRDKEGTIESKIAAVKGI
ncbi:MAG: MTH1187 family thiamine-binding protein [Thermodesulfobacteriota bacterium]|nr:MTH1187 family thiamine-binding protein [Thermodesulfobacteriota bacterium]